MHGGDFGLEANVAIEIIFARDGAAIGKDFRCACVFLNRHIAGFFQQRQIDIAFNVASSTGITVPVPCAAKVATLFDDAHILDARFAQTRSGQHAAETAADHHNVNVVGQRRALNRRFDIRVIKIMRERVFDFEILRIAIGPHALVAFSAIFGAQRRRIKFKVCCRGLAGHSVSPVICFVFYDIEKDVPASPS